MKRIATAAVAVALSPSPVAAPAFVAGAPATGTTATKGAKGSSELYNQGTTSEEKKTDAEKNAEATKAGETENAGSSSTTGTCIKDPY